MKMGIAHRSKSIVLAIFLFAGMFVVFALPHQVEAVLPCRIEGLPAGYGHKGAAGKSPYPFLISGCGSLVNSRTGESIPCYHSLAGIAQVMLSAYNLILGLVGSLALLMFVWGGFQWLISGGSEKRITAGMTTLKNALIGLSIVFGAWLGVNFIVVTLNPPPEGRIVVGLFKGSANYWYEVRREDDPLCYRAMTASELAAKLGKPASQTIGPSISREPAPYSGSVAIVPGDDKPLPLAGDLPGAEIANIPDNTQGTCCYIQGGTRSDCEKEGVANIFNNTKKACRELMKNFLTDNDGMYVKSGCIGGKTRIHSEKFCWDNKINPCGEVYTPRVGQQGFTLGAQWKDGSEKCGSTGITTKL